MRFSTSHDSFFCYICASINLKSSLDICRCKPFQSNVHYDCFLEVIQADFDKTLIEMLNSKEEPPENDILEALKDITKIKKNITFLFFTENLTRISSEVREKLIKKIINEINHLKLLSCKTCKEKIDINSYFQGIPENVELKSSSLYTFSMFSLFMSFIIGYLPSFYKISYIPLKSFLLLTNNSFDLAALFIMDTVTRILLGYNNISGLCFRYFYYLYIGTDEVLFFLIYKTLKYFSFYHKQQSIFSSEYCRDSRETIFNMFGLTRGLFKLHIERAKFFYFFPAIISLICLKFFEMIDLINCVSLYLGLMCVIGSLEYWLFKSGSWKHFSVADFTILGKTD